MVTASVPFSARRRVSNGILAGRMVVVDVHPSIAAPES